MSNNFNAKETFKFLTENPKINTTEATVRRFITGIRNVIYLYYNIQYKSETLGEKINMRTILSMNQCFAMMLIRISYGFQEYVITKQKILELKFAKIEMLLH